MSRDLKVGDHHGMMVLMMAFHCNEIKQESPDQVLMQVLCPAASELLQTTRSPVVFLWHPEGILGSKYCSSLDNFLFLGLVPCKAPELAMRQCSSRSRRLSNNSKHPVPAPATSSPHHLQKSLQSLSSFVFLDQSP